MANKPHKHAELIKAWADGAEIESRYDSTFPWRVCSPPQWYNDQEYRIKPQPVITKAYMHYDGIEELIQKGDFSFKNQEHVLFDNNHHMMKHLEFTFTDNKLTSVEMKNATN
jgi:hypothetical protein